MQKETVYDILLDYFEQRRNATLDTQSIRIRLEKIGKNDDQIHEILIEFVDEWGREMAQQREFKNASFYTYGGASLALGVGFVSMLSALNIQPFARIPIIWYGGVVAGILFMLRGIGLSKQRKTRQDRLKLKYEKW